MVTQSSLRCKYFCLLTYALLTLTILSLETGANLSHLAPCNIQLLPGKIERRTDQAAMIGDSDRILEAAKGVWEGNKIQLERIGASERTFSKRMEVAIEVESKDRSDIATVVGPELEKVTQELAQKYIASKYIRLFALTVYQRSRIDDSFERAQPFPVPPPKEEVNQKFCQDMEHTHGLILPYLTRRFAWDYYTDLQEAFHGVVPSFVRFYWLVVDAEFRIQSKSVKPKDLMNQSSSKERIAAAHCVAQLRSRNFASNAIPVAALQQYLDKLARRAKESEDQENRVQAQKDKDRLETEEQLVRAEEHEKRKKNEADRKSKVGKTEKKNVEIEQVHEGTSTQGHITKKQLKKQRQRQGKKGKNSINLSSESDPPSNLPSSRKSNLLEEQQDESRVGASSDSNKSSAQMVSSPKGVDLGHEFKIEGRLPRLGKSMRPLVSSESDSSFGRSKSLGQRPSPSDMKIVPGLGLKRKGPLSHLGKSSSMEGMADEASHNTYLERKKNLDSKYQRFGRSKSIGQEPSKLPGGAKLEFKGQDLGPDFGAHGAARLGRSKSIDAKQLRGQPISKLPPYHVELLRIEMPKDLNAAPLSPEVILKHAYSQYQFIMKGLGIQNPSVLSEEQMQKLIDEIEGRPKQERTREAVRKELRFHYDDFHSFTDLRQDNGWLLARYLALWAYGVRAYERPTSRGQLQKLAVLPGPGHGSGGGLAEPPK